MEGDKTLKMNRYVMILRSVPHDKWQEKYLIDFVNLVIYEILGHSPFIKSNSKCTEPLHHFREAVEDTYDMVRCLYHLNTFKIYIIQKTTIC